MGGQIASIDVSESAHPGIEREEDAANIPVLLFKFVPANEEPLLVRLDKISCSLDKL